MGRLDHVHIVVPDVAVAAAWYSTNLGFEAVDEYEFWALGVPGGPLQISADGGATGLALFGARDGEPIVPQRVAFSVDAEVFVAFGRSLPGEIGGSDGAPLEPGDLVDFDLCFAYDLVDPWGHQYELNCYDHDLVQAELIDADGIVANRKWPSELHREYRNRS